MEGSLALQEKYLKHLTKQPKQMLIGESSANGVMEFDSRQKIEPMQPLLLVEKRILDEVKRSYNFYIQQCDIFNHGLMYFLYPNSYDASIELFISGAEGAKSVTNFIYGEAKKPLIRKLPPLLHLPFSEITINRKNLKVEDYIFPVLRKDSKQIKLSATSSAPKIVMASINNKKLILRYNPPQTGSVVITIHLQGENLEEKEQIVINIID